MTTSEDVDIIEKSIGNFGRWQLWICLAIFLIKMPIAWTQLNIVFEAPVTDFHCVDNTTERCSPDCPALVFDRAIFSETLISQFNLVCGRAYLANLAQTLTMLGVLIGNLIFGYLSDKFGRRKPLVLALSLQVFTGVGAAFAPVFELHLAMRFLSSVAIGGTLVTTFVIIMEIVGLKWRTTLGVLFHVPFSVGHMTLALFSYFIRDWKYLQIAISAPCLILLSYYWIMDESPRWLLSVGKEKEAVELLEKAAKTNELPIASIRDDVHVYLKKSEESTKSHGSHLDLVRTPVMRIYSISICFNWFSSGLGFFGVSQFVGRLGGNIFLNVAFSAFVQLPATVLALWGLNALGRKKTLIGANLCGGISLLLIGFLPDDYTLLKTALSLVGLLNMSITFMAAYIYAGEVFPTPIRNIGVGTSSMFARVGSMIAPFVSTLDTVNPSLPTFIMGVTPVIGAAMCFFLPETYNCKLPETIEEVEKLGKKK